MKFLCQSACFPGSKDGMVVQNDIETGACIRTWQVHEGAARGRRLVLWIGR